MDPACRDVPRGAPQRTLSSWYVPGGEMVQPDLCQLPLFVRIGELFADRPVLLI